MDDRLRTHDKTRWAAGLFAAIALAMTGAPRTHAQTTYSTSDAQYVTSSINIDVLNYIVCLEEGMSTIELQQWDMEKKIAIAQNACRTLPYPAFDDADEPDRDDVARMIMECGFRPGDSSPDMGCGGSPDRDQHYAESDNTAASQASDIDLFASEERPGVMLEYIYGQEHEGVYSTAWHGRLETKNGQERYFYFEGTGKHPNSGILQFVCNDDNANITITYYYTGSQDGLQTRTTEIQPDQMKPWAGELLYVSLPYAVFAIASYRHC